MTDFTDDDFLELFFDTGHVEYYIYDVEKSETHFGFSVQRSDDGSEPVQRTYALDYFENLKAAVAPWSSSIANCLLRILWIREVKFEMVPPTKVLCANNLPNLGL